MAKRVKKQVLSGVSREQMEEAMGLYAMQDAQLQQLYAKMDVEIAKIRDKYADKLAGLQNDKDEAFLVIESFALDNKDELFSKKKSMDTAHGVIGFRTGTPKLKTKKGFTWSAVLELLREFNPDYVRTTEEVAKDKLLADRNDPDVLVLMDKSGVLVDQDETFWVELKKEEAEA